LCFPQCILDHCFLSPREVRSQWAVVDAGPAGTAASQLVARLAYRTVKAFRDEEVGQY
jgi:hypothetical protein